MTIRGKKQKEVIIKTGVGRLMFLLLPAKDIISNQASQLIKAYAMGMP
jgi:hypothetical protein